MLVHIVDEVCPVCGALVSSEVRQAQHVNGHWNEIRTFQCGCTMNFSPNFMKVSIKVLCPKSKEMTEFNKKRAEAQRSIFEFITTLDVDVDYLHMVRDKICSIDIKFFNLENICK